MKKSYLNKTKALFAGLLCMAAVSTQAQCSVNFTYTLGVNGAVNFAATSSSGSLSLTYYSWQFGDGTSQNSTANIYTASHTYLTNGKKAVCVFFHDSTLNCTTSKCDSIMITGITSGSTTPCNPTVVYSLSKDTLTPLTWNAYPSYPVNVTNATWTWGDGSSSTGLYPQHTYAAAGTYSTCCTVSVSCGTVTATYCYVANIFRASGSSAMIKLNVRQSIPAGIKNQSAETNLLTVYPNPNNGLFTLELNAEQAKSAKVFVYNMVGEVVFEKELGGSAQQNVDVSDLATGTYFVKVVSENGYSGKRIVVQK